MPVALPDIPYSGSTVSRSWSSPSEQSRGMLSVEFAASNFAILQRYMIVSSDASRLRGGIEKGITEWLVKSISKRRELCDFDRSFMDSVNEITHTLDSMLRGERLDRSPEFFELCDIMAEQIEEDQKNLSEPDGWAKKLADDLSRFAD